MNQKNKKERPQAPDSKKLIKANPKQNSLDKFTEIVAKCKQTYDYKDENRDFKAKREKLKAIEQLNNCIDNEAHVQKYIIPNLGEVMQLIEANIFRPLPNIKKGIEEDGLVQEDEYDISW